jgi:hypothetical protein
MSYGNIFQDYPEVGLALGKNRSYFVQSFLSGHNRYIADQSKVRNGQKTDLLAGLLKNGKTEYLLTRIQLSGIYINRI